MKFDCIKFQIIKKLKIGERDRIRELKKLIIQSIKINVNKIIYHTTENVPDLIIKLNL